MENLRAGNIKGAFVLKARMTRDPVVIASMERITLIGLAVLVIVAAFFQALNRRMIVKPLHAISQELLDGASRIRATSARLEEASQSIARDHAIHRSNRQDHQFDYELALQATCWPSTRPQRRPTPAKQGWDPEKRKG